MRRILVENARSKARAKRGGDWRVPLQSEPVERARQSGASLVGIPLKAYGEKYTRDVILDQGEVRKRKKKPSRELPSRQWA